MTAAEQEPFSVYPEFVIDLLCDPHQFMLLAAGDCTVDIYTGNEMICNGTTVFPDFCHTAKINERIAGKEQPLVLLVQKQLTCNVTAETFPDFKVHAADLQLINNRK